MFFRDCEDPFDFAPAAYIYRYSGARPKLNRDENGAQKLTEPATAAAVLLPSQRTGYGERYVTEHSEGSMIRIALDQMQNRNRADAFIMNVYQRMYGDPLEAIASIGAEIQDGEQKTVDSDQSSETSIAGFAESDEANDLGAPKGHDDDEPNDLQGDEEIEIPVANHPENRAESKISSSGVKTEDYESKILEDGQPELKVAADVGYLYNEENDVVKESEITNDDSSKEEEKIQNTTISIEGVHADAGKMEDLKVFKRVDGESVAEKDSLQTTKMSAEELRAEGFIRGHFDELNFEAEELKGKQFKESHDAESWETSIPTTSISSLVSCIAVTALQSSNENKLLHRFDKCSTSSHAGAWGTTSVKDPVRTWGDICCEDPEPWETTTTSTKDVEVWGTTNPTTSDDDAVVPKPV